jgi:hypothetical protein
MAETCNAVVYKTQDSARGEQYLFFFLAILILLRQVKLQKINECKFLKNLIEKEITITHSSPFSILRVSPIP